MYHWAAMDTGASFVTPPTFLIQASIVTPGEELNEFAGNDI